MDDDIEFIGPSSRQFPAPPPPPQGAGRTNGKGKRPADSVSENGSEDGQAGAQKRGLKKRRMDEDRISVSQLGPGATSISVIADSAPLPAVQPAKRGRKPKQPAAADNGDATSAVRKKPGPKKKAETPMSYDPAGELAETSRKNWQTLKPKPFEELSPRSKALATLNPVGRPEHTHYPRRGPLDDEGEASLMLHAGYSGKTAGDATPSVAPASRATSPTPTNGSTVIYELDEDVPALKRAKKVDDPTMVKRIQTLEEAQKKVWTKIARQEVPKVSLLL